MNSFHVNLSIFSLFYCYLFLGLRGAIAFALSLHLDFEDEKRHVIVTTTLIIVLFTLVILGGSTLPLMKVCLLIYMFLFTYLCYLSIMYPRDFITYLSTIDISLPQLLYIFQFLKAEKKRKSKKEVTLFKTKEMVCMTMVTGLSFVLLLWGLPLQFIS